MPLRPSRRSLGRLALGAAIATPTGGWSIANLFVPKADLWPR